MSIGRGGAPSGCRCGAAGGENKTGKMTITMNIGVAWSSKPMTS